MTDYICPRCKGNSISNDLCIICGAYVAPEETLVFVRSGKEPLPPGRPAGKRNEDEERETALLAWRINNKSYYARHSNDPAFIERRRARERDRYARRKDNPAYRNTGGNTVGNGPTGRNWKGRPQMSPARKYSLLNLAGRKEVMRLVRGGTPPVYAIDLLYDVALCIRRRRSSHDRR